MANDPAPAPIYVHGDSLRVGIRLACYRFQNRVPAEDQVLMMQESKPSHVIVSEFPMQAISNLYRDKQARRREYAMHAMQIILSKGSSEFTNISQEEIERIAIKAWQMASAMESQEAVSATLDSMDAVKKT